MFPPHLHGTDDEYSNYASDDEIKIVCLKTHNFLLMQLQKLIMRRRFSSYKSFINPNFW